MRRKKKREEGGQERRVRRRTGRDAGQNAQRAGACASGWGWGWGRRAPRGQEETEDARATRQRGARPGLAPPPAPPLPRAGRRLGLPAPGYRGSRRGRGLAAPAANGQCNGPRRGGPALVAWRGREGGERSGLRGGEGWRRALVMTGGGGWGGGET